MVLSVPLSVRDVDLSDADFFVHGDPHAAWRLLRAEAPMHWNEPSSHHWAPAGRDLSWPGHWNVTRYDDVFRISRDPETFVSSSGIALAPDVPADLQRAQQPDSRGRMLIMSDPPRHTRLRQLVNRGFTPRSIARLEPHIRDIAREIVDDVQARGGCDFVIDVSARLPLAVICELMGVPRDDWQFMFDITNRAIGSGDPEYQVQGDDVLESQMSSFQYFSQMVAERRREPRSDLVATLVGSEIDGETLEDIDILLFCFLLVVAGNETTRNATTGGMLALMQHPDQLDRLLADASLMDTAIEEILRWTSPVMHMTRTATRDVEIRGQHVREGQRLAMWYPSANRDEDVFSDPDRFDVGRRTNEHVAFGVGEHFCLGANLARLELKVIFEELLARLPGMRLAGQPERLRSNFIGGIKHMRVAW